jgi:predicted permease
MDTMIADDLKYGWRQLVKAPGFTLTAVLTLGLAIGANTAVFSLVDAVLLKSLPYPQPERLAAVSLVIARDGAVLGEQMAHTGAVWEAIRDHVTTLRAAVVSGISARASLVTGDRALPVSPQRVSAGYFGVLGIGPAMGREFTADEDRAGGPAVTILSDRLWRAAFNGDPAVLGRAVLLKGEPHEVVGILPPAFRTTVDADLWTPIRPNTTGEGGGSNYGLIARLLDGVTWAQARAEVAAAADGALNNRFSRGISATHSLMPMQDSMASDVRLPLLLLSAAVGLVLLVACVNLAGLLLARASRRTREIATRLAVGGNRAAVVRQLLVESVVLALAGGLAGLALGALALEGLKATATDLLVTPWGQAALDGRVLAVTLGLTALTAVLFGLVPALQATRLDVQAALAEGGTRSVAGGARGWPRRLLVMAEVALGVVLLVGAGLLVRTFMHLQTQSPGFDPRQVIAASASLEDARYEQHERIEQLFERSLERIQAIPGVASAAVSLGLPYERILNLSANVVGPAGEPGDYLFSTATYVTPGYFETLRLPVPRGRSLQATDTGTAPPVVVVNEVFARRYFREREAVGEFVHVGGAPRQIVGVAANVQQRGGFNGFGPLDAIPAIYLPFAQFPGGGLRVFHGWFSPAWIIRETRDGAVTEQALRRAMADVDPQLPLTAIRGVDEVRSAALARQRVLMLLVAALGALALFLAAIGIHALISSGVTERMRELGIRMALGATVRQTVLDAARPGIVMAVAGLAIGCALAFGATGLIRNLLWGVRENDPLTFAVVMVSLLAVAVAASVLPALRVRRLDPVALLRSE